MDILHRSPNGIRQINSAAKCLPEALKGALNFDLGQTEVPYETNFRLSIITPRALNGQCQKNSLLLRACQKPLKVPLVHISPRLNI